MNTVVERIGELLAQLQSSDFYEREEAVRELGAHGEDEAVAGLVMALEDPDLGIRELAAEQLGRIGGRTASQLLIRFLANEDIGTRNLASEVLIRIGTDAVAPLIENLVSDDDDVRKFIVDALGLIGDSRALGPVCERLWDVRPPKPWVRLAVPKPFLISWRFLRSARISGSPQRKLSERSEIQRRCQNCMNRSRPMIRSSNMPP
jgi:HEAT repeat protein